MDKKRQECNMFHDTKVGRLSRLYNFFAPTGYIIETFGCRGECC